MLTYLGPEGTFCEAALRTLELAEPALTAGSEFAPSATVPAALALVREGVAEAAMVPLENSVEGVVPTTIDDLANLARSPLQIRREVLLPVRFALLVRGDTTLAAIRRVATHPHAEAQVRRWLADQLPQAEVALSSSTSEAARQVAAGELDAAVASPLAAARYGLTIVADDIADATGAVTRFVLVAPVAPPPAATGADRTSVVAYIADDHAGALLEILTEFAARGVNLTRIESRPTGGGLGRYCFSLDCEGHIAEPRVAEALAGLKRRCAQVRYLGSYPRGLSGPPAGAADAVASAAAAAAGAAAEFDAASAWVAGLLGGVVMDRPGPS